MGVPTQRVASMTSIILLPTHRLPETKRLPAWWLKDAYGGRGIRYHVILDITTRRFIPVVQQLGINQKNSNVGSEEAVFLRQADCFQANRIIAQEKDIFSLLLRPHHAERVTIRKRRQKIRRDIVIQNGKRGERYAEAGPGVYKADLHFGISAYGSLYFYIIERRQ
jgi:hypothetical protein